MRKMFYLEGEEPEPKDPGMGLIFMELLEEIGEEDVI